MYNILVINGLNYLGSNYIRHVLNNFDEYRIINLDTFDKMYDPLYDIQHKNYFFVKGDCNEYNLLLYILNHYDIDIIINFSLDSSQKTWYYIMKYHNLVNACLDYGKLKKFINMSTEDVYSTYSNTSSCDENSEIYPNTEFSCINIYIENILKYYFDKFEFPYINCRICSIFGNVYEENKDDLYQKAYYLIKHNIIHTNNEGYDQNTYLHILDFCEALCIIVSKASIDNTYNIGSPNMITESDIFKFLKEKYEISDCEINSLRNLNFYKNKKPMNLKKLYELGWNGPTISIFHQLDIYVNKIYENNQI